MSDRRQSDRKDRMDQGTLVLLSICLNSCYKKALYLLKKKLFDQVNPYLSILQGMLFKHFSHFKMEIVQKLDDLALEYCILGCTTELHTLDCRPLVFF